MREWQWASDVQSLADVQPLVDSFFVNDPYYPRPRPSDALYAAFKSGYRSAFYASVVPLADRFLEAIESEQAARDARANSVAGQLVMRHSRVVTHSFLTSSAD